MKRINSALLLLVIMILHHKANSQDKDNLAEGTVSYITGQSIYVKFESTVGIENGDTLFIRQEGILLPVLLVTHHSSISCLCNYSGDIILQLADRIYAKIKLPQKPEITKESELTNTETEVNEQVLKSAATIKKVNKQSFGGSLSLSSYSNLYNNTSENNHRFRYTLTLNADHISNSKLSFESYISFSHKLNDWTEVKKDIFNALKIYSLSLNYSFNDRFQLWFGRKINPNIANIGAIDGLQAEHTFGKFYAGIAVGSRPDFDNFSFNQRLFEVGGYLGHSLKSANGSMQSSLAFFEQRNNSKTDRRFIYFQHINSLIKKVSLFSSVELDLYKLENNQPASTLSLTGLYLSLQYRISGKFSIFTSYDSRKNVIYYETFKNYADLIIQDATRQGLRFRINYRPSNFMNIGFDAGTRFQKNDSRRTNTLNGFSSISRLPFKNSTLTLSANLMQTSYLNGETYGAMLTNDFFKGKLNMLLDYRLVNFRYLNSESKLLQNIGELSLAWQCNKKLYLSVNYETTFQKNEIYNLIYLNLRKKF